MSKRFLTNLGLGDFFVCLFVVVFFWGGGCCLFGGFLFVCLFLGFFVCLFVVFCLFVCLFWGCCLFLFFCNHVNLVLDLLCFSRVHSERSSLICSGSFVFINSRP